MFPFMMQRIIISIFRPILFVSLMAIGRYKFMYYSKAPGKIMQGFITAVFIFSGSILMCDVMLE